MIRTAMARINDPSKLSPEAYLRKIFGFREQHFQQQKHGVRTLAGEEIIDRKSGENITPEFITKPLEAEAKKSGEKLTDLMANAHSVMAAQRTLEKAAYVQSKGDPLEESLTGIGKNLVMSPGTPGEPGQGKEATRVSGPCHAGTRPPCRP